MNKYKIANIVAYTTIDSELDLNRINLESENTEYEPEIYFALIYRLTEPKISVLVNKSGKLIFTGAKSLEDIKKARSIFYRDLSIMGYHPKYAEINISNIVIISEVDHPINLERVIRANQDRKIEYNPESFSGIVLKNESPKFTALIFRTGKVSIVGINNMNYIEDALQITHKVIEGGTQ